MADEKLTQKTENSSPALTDYLEIVDNPAVTPLSQYITVGNLINSGLQTVVGTVVTGNVDAVVSAASVTTAGKVEIATAAETTTGTDATRAVSPDGLAGSDYGKRIIEWRVVDKDTTLTAGDTKDTFYVPSEINGWNLVNVAACVDTVSSGAAPTVQLNNATQAADMLTTEITIDANERTSYTAATPAVIDTTNDDVATGDAIDCDVDVAGTGTKGLVVILTFQLP